MTIQETLSTIESRRKDAERIRLEIATAERQLCQSIRARMSYNGLDFGIVARRMGCQMHHLTNFFCNGQAMAAGRLSQLLEAIQHKPTAAERKAKKRQTVKRAKF